MPNYRCYSWEASGKMKLSESFDAADDEAACTRAAQLCKKHKWPKFELWEGGRAIECAKTGNPEKPARPA